MRSSGLLEGVERLVVEEHRALFGEVLGEQWSPPRAYRWIRYEDPDPLERLADATERLERLWRDHRVGFQERVQAYGAAEERELDRLEALARQLERRLLFDEDAERYQRARPTYPPGLVGDLVLAAGLDRESRVLEIGPGTGQLTLSLAERGCEVTAVEIGPQLAALAARRLARYPRVRVVVGRFEDLETAAEPFDLVVAATAWHWLDPVVRGPKAASALRPGGHLAVIGTHHVQGPTPDFFRDVQDCYLRFDPNTTAAWTLPAAEDVPAFDEELPPALVAAGAWRYPWDVVYTSDAYLDVLQTYSDIRAMEPARRARLLECIRQLMEERHGGRIIKRYLFELTLFTREQRPESD